jgi:hypothetical protein
VRAESHLRQAILRDVPNDVSGISHAAYIADLVTVIRRNRHFYNPLPGIEQLNDDLRIEIEAVGVVPQRQLGQHGDLVRSVTRMKLSQFRAE